MAADVHEYATTAEHFSSHSIQLCRAPTGQQRDAAYGYMRSLFRQGAIRIPPDERLIRQLLSLTYNPTPSNALGVVLPRSGGGHCDLAAALMAMLWLDRRHGPIGVQLAGPTVMATRFGA